MGINEFDKLKHQMQDFESQLQDFLSKAQQELKLKDEVYWGSEKNKLSLISSLKEQLAESKNRQDGLREELESSQRDVNEASAQKDVYQDKKKRLVEERDFLQRELFRLEELLKQQMMDLEREKESRQVQNKKDASEVSQFEKILGIKISAESNDILTFTFSDNDMHFSITLDISENGYKITNCIPELPLVVKRQLVEDLNSSDDIRSFLKNARFQLVSAV